MSNIISATPKSVETWTVFGAAMLVQYIVPAPLDSLLLPGAVTYWWISTNQNHWIVEQVSQKASETLQKVGLYCSEVLGKKAVLDEQTPK